MKASDGSETIRARRFELVDERGAVRAKLECREEDSAPAFTLLDAGAMMRLCVTVAEEVPTIEMYDGQGKRRLVITLRDDEQPDLFFLGADERPRFGIALEDSRVEMSGKDEDGRLVEPMWFSRERNGDG